MGQYFALNVPLSRGLHASEVVTRIQCLDELRLVGVGGRFLDHYFLSGHGLESFVAHYFIRRPPAPASVTVIATERQTAYLNGLLLDAQKNKLPTGLSPSERADASIAATQLEDFDTPEVTAALGEWNQRFPLATIHFVCAIRLVFHGKAHYVFRELFDRDDHVEPVPFLRLSLSSAEGEQQLGLSSQSHVWLRHGVWTKTRRLAAADADANVALLARIAKDLVDGRTSAEHPPTLRVDGRAFRDEQTQLHDAFARALPRMSSEVGS